MNHTEQYAKLLRQINSEPEKFQTITGKTHTESERKAVRELITDEYIIGRSLQNGDILQIKPTLKGRLFQDELEQKIYEQTFKGRMLKHVPIIIAVVLGFFFSAILEILKKYIF